MACSTLPHIKISKDSPEDDIKKLLKVIKPEWNDTKLRITTLSGGYSNDKYWVRPDDESDVGITFRVRRLFEKNNMSYFADPALETKAVQHISTIGGFPKVYAVFGNGYCYQYVVGKPIANLAKPEESLPFHELPLKEIAEKLADIHFVKLEGINYTKTNFFDKVNTMLDLDYSDKSSDVVDRNEIKREINELIDICNKHFKPVVTLCHGDPHIGNILWNKETKQMTFMDWELVNVGYAVFDLSYLINWVHMNEVSPFPGFPIIKNPAETKRLIAKYYYDRWCQLNSECDGSNYGSFEEFYKLLTFFSLVYYLVFVVMIGSVENKKEDLTGDFFQDASVGVEGMMKNFYRKYCENKEELIGKTTNK